MPVIQQIVQNGIEVLVGRIPWLQQIMVDSGIVNCADSGIGVGVGSKQSPLRIRKEFNRFAEERDACHVGHALIYKEQGDGFIAFLKFAERVQCLLRIPLAARDTRSRWIALRTSGSSSTVRSAGFMVSPSEYTERLNKCCRIRIMNHGD